MLVFLFFSIYTPFSCLLILRALWFVFSLSSSPAPPPFVWIQARTTNPLALKMLGTVLLPALLNKWSSLSLLFFLVFLFLMMLVLFILYISLNKGASLSTQFCCTPSHLLCLVAPPQGPPAFHYPQLTQVSTSGFLVLPHVLIAADCFQSFWKRKWRTEKEAQNSYQESGCT